MYSSISCSTLVKFYDNTVRQLAQNAGDKRLILLQPQTIQAYVDSSEGIDRAGGFAIQVGL